ncbi:hypothetical protein EGK75_11425 [Neisseria weixii]|uniref:Adhesin n=1 Tax=Neisseria weixii TaxID=1853276 RepID=A0A3N4MLW4_9NEIS|nr:YadA-like family protein [Neisseria weixii]RPD84188.1 hypothetical protein EGK74_11305 [Neisseria weixii]RPD84781.1 hypothetical protein EGK75_11425 [Neisseria weixii]
MNKSYRSIWNESLGAWVAVSEIENAKGKPAGSQMSRTQEGAHCLSNNRVNKLYSLAGCGWSALALNFALITGFALLPASEAVAATCTQNDATLPATSNTNSFACGSGANASGNNAVAIGQSVSATTDVAFAAGFSSVASGAASLAIGDRAKAVNVQGIAIGQLAEASSGWDISIGRNAGSNPVQISPEARNVAIGDGALRYGTGANNNIGLGTDAGAGLNGAGNVILGTYANATQAVDAAVRAGTPENQIEVKSITVTASGSTNINSVKSVTASNSVVIGNRALATSAGSVAVGQTAKGLGATTVAVGNSSRSLGNNAVAVGNTANAGAAGAIAIGQHANYQQSTSSYRPTGANSIAVGVRSNSSAMRSIAIGTDALAEKATVTGGKIYDKAGTEYNASVAGSLLKAENSIAIGAYSVVRGTNAAAIGQASEAIGQNSFAGGNDVHAIGKSSLALGDGARSENDSTIAIGYVARSTHQNSTAIGNDAQSSATGALAIGKGTRATGTGNVVLGVDSKGETASVVAIGNTSLANQENSVAIGNKATAQGTGNVAIGTNSGNVDIQTYSGIVGNNTVFVGVDAGRNATGNQGQVAVGWQAGQGSVGTFNVASGYQAGQFINGSNNVAIGKQAGQGTAVPRVSASDTVAIGTETKATANNAIAIGKGAQATGLQSISIGVGNIVSGTNSGALGDPSHITGTGTYAIGNDNGTVDNPIAADNAGVFGNLNLMTADADNSRAIGNYNHITTDSTYVLGSGINSDPAGNTLGTTAANSVYLGNDSQVADGAANAAGTLFNTDILNVTGSTTSAGATGTVNSAVINGITYTGFAGQTAVGAVTVGAADSERRLQNVAAGEISATSTDAINGSQLYIVTKGLQDAQTHYYSVNDGGTESANYDNTGATGLNAMAAGVAAQATAVNATAVGHLANASADNATVLGNEATATAKDTVAVGQSADATADSAVAVGKSAQSTGNFAVSIGLDSKATNNGAVAMGSGAVADNTYTVAIGNDAQALQDGATALGRLAKAESEKSLALGTKSQVTSLNGIAIGVDAKALGGTTGTTKTGNIAIGNAAQTESNDSVVIGTNTQATVSAENAIVIGKNAAANNGGGNNSVAIGKDAVVTANGSIALGEEAKATAFTTATGVNVPDAGMITAIGYKAAGSGIGSLALGSNASTTQNAIYSVAIGNGATAGSTDASGAALRGGRYGVAVGNSAKAIADNSAAFGPSAQAQNTGSLALGHSAIASVNSGVALGANSLADVAGGMVGADPLLAASDKNNSTWTSSALYGAVSVGSSVHGITRQITNLAAGTADTDAVNVAQLKAAGFNLATSASDGEQVDNTAATEDTKVPNGETVTVDAGKNIKITQSANKISVATKEDVEFTTVTVKDAAGNITDIKGNSLTITPASGNPVSLTSDGLNNGGNVVSGVANGVADNDAATVAQVKAAMTEVEKGTNVSSVTSTTGANGQTVYTVNADGAKASAGSNAVTVTAGAKDSNNVTDYAVDLSEASKTSLAKADSALQSFTTSVNGTTAETIDQTNKQVNFVNGTGTTARNSSGDITFDVNKSGLTSAADGTVTADEPGDNFATAANVADAINKASKAAKTEVVAGSNIEVDSETGNDGQTIYTVKTADSLTVESITADGTVLSSDGLTITPAGGNPVSLSESGLNNGGNVISGVANGVADDDAVNMAQLNAAAAASANKVAAGDNIEVSEKQNDDGSTTYTVATAKNVSFDSVTAGDAVLNQDGVKVGNDVALASDGLKAGSLTVGTNGKISGLEDGSIAAGSKEAVNGSQLYGTADSVANALGGGSAVNADGTVSAPAYTIIDPATGNSSVANNVGDALTKLNGAVNSPLTFAGDSGSNVERKLGTTVNLKGGATGNLTDNNIAVVANGTDTLSIKLAETVNLGSNGSVTTGQTVLNNDGVKVGDSVALTSDGLKAGDVNITSAGIDAGNKQIGGVKAGEQDTDAVNVAQLKAAAAASANKVAAGDNIEVSEKQNDDGSTTYTVATAKNVNFDSVTAGTGANRVVLDDAGVSVGGNTYISGNGINANNQKVTNVASGSVAAGSTDAVNGGQLHNTAASVANVFGGNAMVNPDGSVSMSNIGGTGANNVNDAIAAVNRAAVEAKTTVSTGDNIVVAQSTNADGSTNYTVATEKDVNFNSVTAGTGANRVVLDDAGVSVGGNTYISGNGVNANNQKVTNVAAGNVAAGSTDAVNGGQLYDTAVSVANVLGGNATVNPGGSVSMSNIGGTGANNVDDAIKAVNQTAVKAKTTVNAGDNIVVAQSTNTDGSANYTVSTAKDLVVDSVTAGDTVLSGTGLSIANGPSITADGLDAGDKKITNVADGEISATSKDAVNGSQLHQTNEAINSVANYTVNMGNQLNQRIDSAERRANAGAAAAMAVAGLPQAYLPGKSMVAVAGSAYRGESGYALGYSSISDNGNWVIKGSATGNSRGHYGATAGVGYQW